MKVSEIREKYQKFFEGKQHARINSASLIPENDPTVLFTTAGMQPLVPYLLGQPHPKGKRLVSVQKCVRTGDIDEVGDMSHLTIFEMLGNWSLGDYFKKESITWSFEFLTKELKIPITKLAVSVFEGDENAPKDEQSAKIWQNLGVPKDRISYLPKSENWWGPAGQTGPCGPDTEIFYWNSNKPAPKKYDSNDETWLEIWNNVFMEYNKTKSGAYEPLKQKNVDTGMGLERISLVMQNVNNVFETNDLKRIMNVVKKITNIPEPNKEELRSIRIITDHIRASVFMIGDERPTIPKNVEQGYVLRRLIRRALRHLRLLGSDIKQITTKKIAQIIIQIYSTPYPELKQNENKIYHELELEEKKFLRTLEKGLKEFQKITNTKQKEINGKQAFLLYQSYGFPLELITELAQEKKIKVDEKGFLEEQKKHQQTSKKAGSKRFSGGLADHSETSKMYHTCTHLLNQALRVVVNPSIHQRGSNITQERMRFDFNTDRAVTQEELRKIEDLVNQQIKKGLKVTKTQTKLETALKNGAESEFGVKYPDEVFVYQIGGFSKEICGGPHVSNTKEILPKKFKIVKQKSIASGIRRIRAILE